MWQTVLHEHNKTIFLCAHSLDADPEYYIILDTRNICDKGPVLITTHSCTTLDASTQLARGACCNVHCIKHGRLIMEEDECKSYFCRVPTACLTSANQAIKKQEVDHRVNMQNHGWIETYVIKASPITVHTVVQTAALPTNLLSIIWGII